eukprot:scaffold62076_cov81-Phaeocystis_antarctica.AAC.2
MLDAIFPRAVPALHCALATTRTRLDRAHSTPVPPVRLHRAVSHTTHIYGHSVVQLRAIHTHICVSHQGFGRAGSQSSAAPLLRALHSPRALRPERARRRARSRRLRLIALNGESAGQLRVVRI